MKEQWQGPLAARVASDGHPFFSEVIFCPVGIIEELSDSGLGISLSQVLPIMDHTTFLSRSLGNQAQGSRIGKRA